MFYTQLVPFAIGGELDITASLLDFPPASYLSPSRRLSQIRSFWKNRERDRLRNIYRPSPKPGAQVPKKSIANAGMPRGLYPTSSLNIPYLDPPITKDGQLIYPSEISNYHFACSNF